MFAESFLCRFLNIVASLSAFYVFGDSLGSANIFKCLPKFAKNDVYPVVADSLLFRVSFTIGNS